MTRLSGIFIALALCLLLFNPQQAAAGDPVHAGAGTVVVTKDGIQVMDAGHENKHGGDHGKAGLPQFDPSSFPSQIFWLAIVFSVLYIFFSRKTLPEISKVIEGRNEHIQSNVDTAEDLREQAEEVHKSYEESLENARAEATKFYADVQESIKDNAAKQYDAYRNRASKEISELEKRLVDAKNDAMDDMNEIAAEIASQAAEKIVGLPADINQARSVVESLSKDKTTKKKAA